MFRKLMALTMVQSVLPYRRFASLPSLPQGRFCELRSLATVNLQLMR